MNNVVAAIHSILSSDTELAGMLATYKGLPAIFTAEVPEQADFIYAIVDEPFANPQDNMMRSKTRVAREPTFDVRFYDDKTTSAVDLNKAADRGWQLLHQNGDELEAELGDHEVKRMVASGPSEGPDEDDAEGRIVTVTINLTEK